MGEPWKYFLPNQCEDASDAVELRESRWRRIHDAEDAAQMAADDEWDNRDGWESGVDSTEIVCVIAPDGTITRWAINHEASVSHSVEEIEDSDA